MREPKIDDLVIHINEGNLVGWSYVSAPFRELTEGPPAPGQWAGRPSYYRVDLKGYQEFPSSIPLTEFTERNRAAIEEELKKDAPKRYPFVLYGGKDVRHAQGAYLTRCTPKLYELIRANLFGGAIPHNARYWAMSLGEGGRLWDECQEKGIAAIGWDEFELGDLSKYPDRESIQQILIEKRGGPGPTPSSRVIALDNSWKWAQPPPTLGRSIANSSPIAARAPSAATPVAPRKASSGWARTTDH